MKSATNIFRRANWFQVLLGVYTSLFIFTMANKEFVLFGLDLRYILLPLGGLIIMLSIILKKYKGGIEEGDGVGKALIIFYVFALLSNISWLWCSLQPIQPFFENEIILVVNILVSVVVFYLNRKRLNYSVINVAVILSCIVLTFSMIMVHQGFSIADISGAEGVTYKYSSSALVQNTNAFGENSRIAGYASDPNYATVILLIGVVCSIKYLKKPWLRAIIVALFVLAIGLSFSRTIVLASAPCALYAFFQTKGNMKLSTKVFLNRILLALVLASVIIIPYLTSLTQDLPITLTQRFSMWRRAGELFIRSPIIGSGLTSFRSFFYVDGWYVQAHSTYWQIISEFGIIGMVLYYNIVSKVLDRNMSRPIDYFLTLVSVIWIITCETIALPFSIFVYYLISVRPTATDGEITQKKRALFFVNSLKQGGAERVCVNLGKEMLKQGMDVDFILLNYDKKTFNNQSNVDILDLGITSKNKATKMFKIIMAKATVDCWLSNRISCFGEYKLITSHLPMSNIVTRFSTVGKRALYVFHTRVGTYQIGSRWLYKTVLKLFFRKRRVVVVSSGLKDEYINKYGACDKFVKIIYNPVDAKKIREESAKDCKYYRKFILHVGRFSEAKNQKRMIDVFKEGGFYKKYDLVFCGTGEMEQDIKDYVNQLGLGKNVCFMGYQDNIYSWMNKSEVLVSTSNWEAFPMNLVEAFASGAKVVSSDCDFGPREIMLGEYARFLVSPIGDIGQYVEKINLAIKNYPIRSNPILEKCDPVVIISEYEEFYGERN